MKYPLLTALAACLLSTGAQAQDAKPMKEDDIERIALKVSRETVQGDYQLISVADLKKMIEAKEDFVLVDAHPPKDFAAAYIEGAVNFGFAPTRLGRWEDDAMGKAQEDYKTLLGSDPKRKIVAYCGFNACGRSHVAAMWAKELGYANVYRVPGGTRAWKDAGYEYKTAARQ